jgi:alpha-ketoglutarate-dependent taurine dioxygenase
MNINIKDNWVVEISDFDIRTATKEEALAIGKYILSNMVVVLKNQDLEPEDEVAFCSKIGKCQFIIDPTKPREGQRTENLAVGHHILRVTGQKNEKGEEGLFGHTSALDWHANQASNYEREPLIWLYGVEGTAGSKTSWINNIESYNALSEEFKKEIQDIQITLGYKSGSYSPSKFFVEHHSDDKPFRLVHVNDAGYTGLYFPFLQIFGMPGKTEEQFKDIMSRLIKHVTQPQFCYDHYWEDGDVVLSEQWLSIHKRWAFDKMEERILHRIAFNYENLL